MGEQRLEQEEVCGVAYADGLVFVITKRSNTVQTFTLAGLFFRHHDKFTVNGLQDPQDIVADRVTNHLLYIADEKCVWRVNAKSRDGIEKLCKTEYAPRSLSMNSERLLVICSEAMYIYRVGDRTASTTPKTISMSDVNIHHAVETKRGTYVLCASGLFTPANRMFSNTTLCKIIEVNGDGEKIRTYYGDFKINEIVHLALHSDGRVIVADHRRVAMLDADWDPATTTHQVLVDRQLPFQIKEHRPIKTCFVDRERGLLVVGLCEEGVKLYRWT